MTSPPPDRPGEDGSGAGSGGGPDEGRSLDERFAEIVAGWHAAPEVGPAPPDQPQAPEPPPWRGHTPAPDPDDERYIPPPPAPLPRHDWRFWGALIGVTAGPLWLIYQVVASPYGERWPRWAAGALTVAGFVLVIRQLPARHDDEDNGARV